MELEDIVKVQRLICESANSLRDQLKAQIDKDGDVFIQIHVKDDYIITGASTGA